VDLQKDTKTILLVDDEADILEFLEYNLEKEGYRIIKARNGHKSLKLAREYKPDLILLDVIMPGMNGIEVCTEMMKFPELKNTVIAFLTAKSDDYSQIKGLEAGGDFYIFKPIKPRLLISRIKAMLRSIKPIIDVNSIQSLHGIIMDPAQFLFIKDGKEIQLHKREFELLSYLLSRGDKLVTRDEIFANVWGDNVIVTERTIDVHIHRIREKLGIELIRTLKGVGFKLEFPQ